MGQQSNQVTAAGKHHSLLGSTAGLYDPLAEESVAVLRGRAENLLDEMLLSAGDIGGDYGNDYSTAGYTTDNSGSRYTNGAATALPAVTSGVYPETDASGYDSPPVPPAPRDANGYWIAAAPAADRADADAVGAPGAAARGGDPASLPRVVAAEDRYAAVDDSAAARTRPDGASPVNGAVRRQSSLMASTMTIGARAALRSNLLPRSTEVDANAAQHEIDELQHEVVALLPPGHEATERCRHLLNKAQTILTSDQSRSAEIEYYLQQVRRILERAQQRKTWSDLYRTRLWTYLVSWTLLALVVMIGIGLYRGGFALVVADFLGLAPDSPWVLFAGMMLVTACAGALGAIMGVYVGIARRQRTEYGYFDRKYGLRGLLMPIFGFLFGALIAATVAALFHVTGVDPNQSTLILIPIVLAFFVGVGQESLYGAR